MRLIQRLGRDLGGLRPASPSAAISAWPGYYSGDAARPGPHSLSVVLYLCRLRAMRRTHALIQVALALMEDPPGRHWGYDLSRRAGVRSGVLYPILHRMLDEGWLEDGWEDPAQLSGKRPPRRYYELTDQGRIELGALLQDARSDARFRALIGRYA